MRNLRQLFRRSGWLSTETSRNRTAGSGRVASSRRLNAESLEKRQLLAGDIALAHNYLYAADVDQNREITANDALMVLNFLNSAGSGVQITNGVEIPGMVDVNGDHHVTAADALAVINALNLGEGAGELVELQLTPRSTTDQSLLATGTRTATVEVGQLFYLELSYQDLRTLGGDLGAFQISTDIGVSEVGALEPLLTEIQTVRIQGIDRAALQANQLTGSFFFNLEGRNASQQVEITAAQFRNTNPIQLMNSVMTNLGYTTSQFRVSNQSPAPTAQNPNPDFIFQVRFIDLGLANQDLPNLTLTNTITGGSTTVVTPTPASVPPILPGGGINGAALPSTLDVRSRTFQQSDTPNLEFYNQRQFGTFVPGATLDPTDNVFNVFNEVGAIGRVNANGIPAEDGRGFAEYPFDAFAIPVRFTRPVSNFRISLNPAEGDEAILLYPGGDGTKLTQDQVLIDADGAFTITAVAGSTNPGTLAIAATASVNENAGAATFTVNRTGGSDGSVTVAYATANGTATAPADFAAATGTLTFAAGETTKTFTVNIVDDTLVEGNENFTINLTNATGGATLGNATSTVTIVDNDVQAQPGVLAFSAATASVNENAGTVTLTVNRTGGSQGAVAVNFATANGTAIAPGDYTTTTGTVNFAAGETTKTITVPIINDAVNEQNETFTVTLTAPTGGATLGTIAQATVTIVDDDPVAQPGVLAFNPATVSVNEAAGTATLTVTRTGGSSGAVSASFATANGTATAGSDYTAQTGTVSFAAGETSKTITIPIINDTADEPNETFTVTLTAPTGGATIGTAATATVTIVDNDDPVVAGALAVPATLTVNETAGNAVITVSRTGGSGGSVSVNFATANGTALAGSDYTTTTGTLTFAAGETSKTISVPIISDSVAESNETFTVTLTNPTGGATLGNATTTVTITNVTTNRPPVVTGPVTQTFAETAAATTVSLLTGASDPDGDTLAVSNVTVASGDARGITISGTSLNVNPAAYTSLVSGQSAVIVYNYSVVDGRGGSVAQTATITITGVNTPPVANPDPNLVAFAGTTTRVNVLGNDNAGGGETQGLTLVSAVANDANATVVANSDGTVSVTPVPGFVGTTAFTYTVRDAGGLTASAVGTVVIRNFNPSTVSGSVFFDYIENIQQVIGGAAPFRDGVLDANEDGLGGVPVRLTLISGDNIPDDLAATLRAGLTVLTQLDGSYRFENLPPGTYRVSYTASDSVIYGRDFINAVADTDGTAGQMGVSIAAAGGLNLSNFNFTLFGMRGDAANSISYLDHISSGIFSSDSPLAIQTNNGREGGTVMLSSTGLQQSFLVGEGFNGVRFAELTLNNSHDAALLTIIDADGSVKTARLNSDRFVVNDEGTAVRFFGGKEDFTFVTAEDDLLEAEFVNYRNAIDQILGGA